MTVKSIKAARSKLYFLCLGIIVFFIRSSLYKTTRKELTKENPKQSFHNKHIAQTMSEVMLSSKSWLLYFLITVIIGFFLPIINIPFLNIIPEDSSFLDYLVKYRMAHTVALLSILFTIVGIALSNLAKKNAYTYRILIKQAYIYPVLYTLASTTICNVIIYVFASNLNLILDIERICISMNYMFIISVCLTAFSFTKILRFVDEDRIYEYLNDDVKKMLKQQICRDRIAEKSSSIYRQSLEGIGAKYYYIEPSSKNHIRLRCSNVVNKSDKKSTNVRYVIEDINIKRLKFIIKLILSRYPDSYLLDVHALCTEIYNENLLVVTNDVKDSSKFLLLVSRCYKIKAIKKTILRQNSVEYLKQELLTRTKEGDQERVSQILDIQINVYENYLEAQTKLMYNTDACFILNDVTAQKAIDIALENKDTILFEEIMGFHFKLLYLALDANAIDVISSIQRRLSYFYIKTIMHVRNDTSYEKIKNLTSKRITSNLLGLTQMIGYRFDSDMHCPENETLVSLYEVGYVAFTRIIYYHIMNQDWGNLNNAINDFNESSPENATGYNWDDGELWENYLLSQDEDKRQDLRKLNITKREPNKLWFNAKLGLMYWSLFLYSKNIDNCEGCLVQMNPSTLNKIKSYLKDTTDDIGLTNNIDNLIEVINSTDYLEMNHWDYIERLSGRVYSPPELRNWFLKGFVYDLLVNNKELMLISNINHDRIRFIYTDIINEIKYYKVNYQKWEGLVQIPLLEFEKRADEYIKRVTQMLSLDMSKRFSRSANLKINEEIKKLFIRKTLEVWESESAIHNLCKLHGCKVIESAEESLEIKHGRTHHFSNYKQIWSEDSQIEYSSFGAKDYGRYLCRLDENLFYQTIAKDTSRIRFSDTVLNALDAGINELSKCCKPVIIIMHSRLFQRSHLYESKDYVPHWNNSERNAGNVTYSLYKGMKLIITYNDTMKSRVLVCDIHKAFQVSRSQKEEYYDGYLYVDYRELNEKELEHYVKTAKSENSSDEYGKVLSDKEIEDRVRCGIMVETWLYQEYVVGDKDCYLLFELPKEASDV